MPRQVWLIGWLGMFLLAACSPEVLTVEVTRMVPVDVTPELASATVVPAAPVEVTRVVTMEVTRVVTAEVMLEPTYLPPGSAARPLQFLFTPQISTELLQERAGPLVEALEMATGRDMNVGIVDDEAAALALLCAAPQETIALLSPLGAGRAGERCGSQALAVGVTQNGLSWEAGMIVVRRDSGLSAPADLDGKIWAVGDDTSLTNFLYMRAWLAEMGIVPAGVEFFPGDNTALLAVFNGEADFATATYLPPVLPFAERDWVYGQDDPELWRRLGIPPARSGQGFVVVNGPPEFGGYRVRDARSGIFDTTPEIFAATEIMTLTPPLPIETLVVGADFPLGLARQLETAVTAFGSSAACVNSLCAADYLNWSAILPAAEETYAPLRLIARYEVSKSDQ